MGIYLYTGRRLFYSNSPLLRRKTQNANDKSCLDDVVKEHCKDFGGTLSDKDCMKLCGIARNTYYRYKEQIINE